MVNKKYIINVGISRAKSSLCLLLPDNQYGLGKDIRQVSGYENLKQIKEIMNLLDKPELAKYVSLQAANEIEKVLFNKKDYIHEESLLIRHEQVNVYKHSPKRYLVSHDDEKKSSIDVQIQDVELEQ